VTEEAILLGAVAGLGLFLLAYGLIPRRPGLARRIAEFDLAPGGPGAPATRAARMPAVGQESQLSRRLGAGLVRFCAEQGWHFPSLRADLRLTGRSLEVYLANKVLLAMFGLLFAPFLEAMAVVAGIRVPVAIPVWVGLVFAVVFFFLPDLEMRSKVARMRRDFRHAIGAFLDLVAMNLAGGRGVPEALMAASEIGSGWAFSRIREALANARITGLTPWQALGALGDEVRVDELRDLASALGLVADDGAKVRESLTSRAVSLRRRELADLQGQAGERSQSMLLAQMLLCIAFLIFLMYPAVRALTGV
jgi:tight adherence protein C